MSFGQNRKGLCREGSHLMDSRAQEVEEEEEEEGGGGGGGKGGYYVC